MVRANLLPLALTQALILTPGFARRATELWRKAAPLEADMLHLGLFRHLTPPDCIHRLVEQRERSGHRTASLIPLFVRLRCPLGMNTGQQAYVISRRGAARARKVLLPLLLTRTLTLTLTRTPNPNPNSNPNPTPTPYPNPDPNTRKALLPLRVNTSVPGQHAASFDLLLGRASMVCYLVITPMVPPSTCSSAGPAWCVT